MNTKYAFAFLTLCSTLGFPTLPLASTGAPVPELLINGAFGMTEHQAMCFISVYSDGELRVGYGTECWTEDHLTDPDCISTRLSGAEMNRVQAAIQTIHSEALTFAHPIRSVQYLDGYDFHLGGNPELKPFSSNDYPYTAKDKLVGAPGSLERRQARSLRNLLLNHLSPIIRKLHRNN